MMRKTAGMAVVLMLAAVLIMQSLQGCTPFFWTSKSQTLLTSGKMVGRNTIQGDTDIFYRDLWDAVYMVSRIKGVIRQESRARGYMSVFSLTANSHRAVGSASGTAVLKIWPLIE